MTAKECGGDLDQHWLRKMPDEKKLWRYREQVAMYFARALVEFECGAMISPRE